MDLEKLTLKSQEAVSAAQQIAAQRSHQAVEPEHLLYALLSDPDGTSFDRARAVAAQIVEEAPGGDGFSVVLMSAPPRRIVPTRLPRAAMRSSA